MRFARNVGLSCRLLAGHPLRSLLCMAGIVVGVAAVVVMVSLGRGAERRLLDRIHALGTNLLVVHASPSRIVAGRQRQSDIVATLLPADARAVAEDCPSVVRASPAVTRGFVTMRESRTWKTNVMGIAEEGLRIRKLSLRSGRLFDEDDDRAKRRVALLGPTVAENLFGREDPVGLSLLIGRVPFEVVGVLVRRGVDANGTDQDDVVLVPLETAMRRLLNVTHVQAIFVEARSVAALPRAEAEVREVLRGRRRAKADDFTIQNQAALLKAQGEASRSMTLLVGSVAAISLVVGGVGILAVMLISIRERTPEIGLRRSLGARRKDIVVQFLAEAAILAGAGGGMGVLAGVAGALTLPFLGAGEAVLSWPAAGLGLAFSVSVGVAFGVYPAFRAARLEPIQALRASS